MITIKMVDRTFFPQYDLIPMLVHVSSYYRIDKVNRGLGGFTLVETPVEPFVKDFDDDEPIHNFASRQAERFDITNWGFFMAFDKEQAIGGAIVASRTKEVNMLSGRDDLAVLWDIRVNDTHKRRGVGQALFDLAVEWACKEGLVQMKIECQNNNVPAVKFYHKQGAILSAIDEYAYYNDPQYRHEAQLMWFLNL
ncbi:MAG: GNAT family N-acetyltransferase [Clostridiaceae bacterium]|nr:GNAT family N-acetyltransferase [Clostridiaceae bacterium]